jgi:hypothetical protein
MHPALPGGWTPATQHWHIDPKRSQDQRRPNRASNTTAKPRARRCGSLQTLRHDPASHRVAVVHRAAWVRSPTPDHGGARTHQHGTLIRGHMPDAEFVMIKTQAPAFLYGRARRGVPVTSRSGPRHASTPKPIPTPAATAPPIRPPRSGWAAQSSQECGIQVRGWRRALRLQRAPSRAWQSPATSLASRRTGSADLAGQCNNGCDERCGTGRGGSG